MKQTLIIAALAIAGLPHADAPKAIALTPSEIRWSAAGTMALPGLEQAVLLGDPTKPGPYTIRLSVPHYIYTAVATEIQVSGMGPSGRSFVEHAH